MPTGGAGLVEIEVVYRARLGEFRRVAAAIAGGRDAGVDAVQEAFVLAVCRRGQFRREGSLEGWLWRMVVRCAIDAAARSARLAEAPLEEAAAAAAEADEEVRARVRALVGALPERQRVAVFLRYYADLDYAAIAEVLGVRSGTVGATLSQAKANLRRVMMEVRP